MLNRFGQGTTRSAPSLFPKLRSIFNRPGKWIRRQAPRLRDNGENREDDKTISRNDSIIPPSLASNSEQAAQSLEWNIPITPDLMYHIIDSYLTPSMKLALCAALPVLRPYCYPQPFEDICIYIWEPDYRSQKHFDITIHLSISALDDYDKSLIISTDEDFGYAAAERAHGVMSLAANLTQDVTSIELHIPVKWCRLDKHTKAFIASLLRRSGLCSVKVGDSDIPVNLLGMLQNLKILEVYTSFGRAENVFFAKGRGKVGVEKIILHREVEEHWLVGPGSPFDWSGLRVIECHQYTYNLPNIEKLLKLCSSSLFRLDFVLGQKCGYADLSVLTALRHITLSISLTDYYEDYYDGGGTESSLTPFESVPRILASCNGHNTIEKIVLRFETFLHEDLWCCDWLSVDRIFERKGTWMSLKQVMVVIMNYSDAGLHYFDALEPEHLEWVEPSTMPCLQARDVLNWWIYDRGSK